MHDNVRDRHIFVHVCTAFIDIVDFSLVASVCLHSHVMLWCVYYMQR